MFHNQPFYYLTIDVAVCADNIALKLSSIQCLLYSVTVQSAVSYLVATKSDAFTL
jgi:hypothetical protein